MRKNARRCDSYLCLRDKSAPGNVEETREKNRRGEDVTRIHDWGREPSELCTFKSRPARSKLQ